MLHNLVIMLLCLEKTAFLQVCGTSTTYIGFICDAELLPER